MKKILIDMHRLDKSPFNGLYTFSWHLGKSLARHQFENDFDLNFYLGKKNFGIFGNKASYQAHHSSDKFYMRNTKQFALWHVTTSISWYHPFNNHTKNVFTLHDLNFLIEEKENIRRNKRLLHHIQQRINNADYITGISRFVIDHAKQYLNFGHKPIAVVYNGCNVPEVPEYEIPVYKPKNKFIFSIGLVQPRKNFHTLPALLPGNDYELIIAGVNTFDYAAKIMEEAKHHGVENRVKLIGPVTEKEKYWLYKNCEAFCFPSIAEGFGLPVLEAMHFGKPVFISTETAMPEVGGNAAWYFKDFDPLSMQQVFKEGMEEYFQTLPVQKIKAQAAKFNWDKTAGEYLDIYKKALAT
jgi:glycosyltransferase involved in cell wall biosynthesis